jgi:hypothetical protein
MAGYCSTGQSPQRAVVLVEEEEEEEEGEEEEEEETRRQFLLSLKEIRSCSVSYNRTGFTSD